MPCKNSAVTGDRTRCVQVEYTETVGWMLCQHANYDIVTSASVDKNRALLGVYIKKVLAALGQSLLATSEQYR